RPGPACRAARARAAPAPAAGRARGAPRRRRGPGASRGRPRSARRARRGRARSRRPSAAARRARARRARTTRPRPPTARSAASPRRGPRARAARRSAAARAPRAARLRATATAPRRARPRARRRAACRTPRGRRRRRSRPGAARVKVYGHPPRMRAPAQVAYSAPVRRAVAIGIRTAVVAAALASPQAIGTAAAAPCEEETAELRALLTSEARRSRIWNTAWLITFATASAGQLTLALTGTKPLGTFDRDFEETLYVGAAKASLGVIVRTVLPLRASVPPPAASPC